MSSLCRGLGVKNFMDRNELSKRFVHFQVQISFNIFLINDKYISYLNIELLIIFA